LQASSGISSSRWKTNRARAPLRGGKISISASPLAAANAPTKIFIGQQRRSERGRQKPLVPLAVPTHLNIPASSMSLGGTKLGLGILQRPWATSNCPVATSIFGTRQVVSGRKRGFGNRQTRIAFRKATVASPLGQQARIADTSATIGPTRGNQLLHVK